MLINILTGVITGALIGFLTGKCVLWLACVIVRRRKARKATKASGILFMDEMNRCDEETTDAMFKIVNDYNCDAPVWKRCKKYYFH
jgi:hypothetical protein